MIRRPPRSTRTDTLFPYTTLFRSIIKDLTAEPPVHAHSIDNGLAEKIDPTPGTQISPVDERPRTTVAQIQEAILQLMSDGQIWTNAELKQLIPGLVVLSEIGRAHV